MDACRESVEFYNCTATCVLVAQHVGKHHFKFDGDLALREARAEIEQLSQDRYKEQRAKDAGARIVAEMAEKAGGCPIDPRLCDDTYGCDASGGETCPMAALSAILEPEGPA